MTEQFFGKELAARKIEAIPGLLEFDIPVPVSYTHLDVYKRQEEKVANLVYVFAQRFYSFSGLQRYKEKFSPIWSPKYIVYPCLLYTSKR